MSPQFLNFYFPPFQLELQIQVVVGGLPVTFLQTLIVFFGVFSSDFHFFVDFGQLVDFLEELFVLVFQHDFVQLAIVDVVAELLDAGLQAFQTFADGAF